MDKFAANRALQWRTFLGFMCATCAAVLGAAGLFVAVMDPHDHLFFSPPFERAPINTNQRFSYPALARSPRFDSLVLGTSTIRLLKPELMNAAFGGRFVNLAMNSATAYEQVRMYELFKRHHDKPATLLVGIDKVWCTATGTAQRYTRREFPEWLYDENRWNDLLHLLNSATLEQAARQLEYQLGRREPRYGFDGYEHFLPPVNDYDLARARQHLYGQDGSVRVRTGQAVKISEDERRGWAFEALRNLYGMLVEMPADSKKILVFVPYHLYAQPLPVTLAGQQMAECKQRVAAIARKVSNAVVLDFMIDSQITREDRHYWDPLHYTEAIADELVQHIKVGAEGRGEAGTHFERL